MKLEQPTEQVGAQVGGFTILEMIFVLFLLATLFGLIIPRMTFGDNLGSTGRRLIGTFKTLQGMATQTQKPIRLYFDIERGTYWIMILEGKEEKLPLDATWATPFSLPESIRMTDVTTAQGKKTSGRADIWFLPSGRIDPATLYLTEGDAILGLIVEQVTSEIRVTDQRMDAVKPPPILERVRPFLQPLPIGGAPIPASLR
jgi:hypothetical protein